jgi:hypothetical protein
MYAVLFYLQIRSGDLKIGWRLDEQVAKRGSRRAGEIQLSSFIVQIDPLVVLRTQIIPFLNTSPEQTL